MNKVLRRNLRNIRPKISRAYRTIDAIPRTARSRTGAKDLEHNRRQGRLPTLLISPQPSQDDHCLFTKTNRISNLISIVGPLFFYSTLFKLRVWARPGSSILLHSGYVLPLHIEYMLPDLTKLWSLKLAWVDEGSRLEVNVPLVFKGEDSCPGILKGGQFKAVQTKLKYLCPALSIPQKIEVDISNLDIGDQILPNDIQVDPSLKRLSDNDDDDLPICQIVALAHWNNNLS